MFSLIPLGNWSGLLGEIVANRAAIAVNDFEMSTTRSQYVDFLHFFKTDYFIVVGKKGQTEYTYTAVKPYTTEVWYIRILMTVLVAMLLSISRDICWHVGKNQKHSHAMNRYSKSD